LVASDIVLLLNFPSGYLTFIEYTHCVPSFSHFKHGLDRKHVKNILENAVFSYFFVPGKRLKTTLPFFLVLAI